MNKIINTLYGIMGLVLSTTAWATPTVTLTTPTVNSIYNAGSSRILTYTINNYVPKTFPILKITGISSPIGILSNECNPIPAGTPSQPAHCNITLTVNPATEQIGSTINEEIEIYYGGRVPLKSRIAFQVASQLQVYAYITQTFGSISEVLVCTVNVITGALTDCHTTGSNFFPVDIALNSSNTFAFIANADDTTATVCSLDANTGSLFGCFTTASSIAAFGIGVLNETFAYIVSFNSNTVLVCSINQITGALSGCHPTGSGYSSPASITFNPSKTLAYITNFSSNTVIACFVSSLDGELTGCFAVLSIVSPQDLAINKTNTYAYIVGPSMISQCAVDQTTGILSGCVSTGSGFSTPVGIALNAANTFAYITNFGNNTISACAITPSTGALSGCYSTGNNIRFPHGLTIGNPS